MADCPACKSATEHPITCGSYQAGCLSCNARMLSKSPAAKDALLGYPGDLQAAMRKLTKTPQEYTRMRNEVYAWIKLIDAARETT